MNPSFDLSGNTGRIAAVGLLVLALVLAVTAVALPVNAAFRRFDGSIASLKAQLARYDAMERMRTPLQEQLTRLTAQQASAEDLMGGGSASVAGARLQDLIKRHVSDAGGNFVSAQSLPVEIESEFERIGLRVQFNITTEGLARAIQAIEAGKPLLIIENLDIRGRPVRKGDEFDATRAVPLVVTVEVVGFRRQEKI